MKILVTDDSTTMRKIQKRVLKHSIFFVIAFLIGNTFLAYIIGVDDIRGYDAPYYQFNLEGTKGGVNIGYNALSKKLIIQGGYK